MKDKILSIAIAVFLVLSVLNIIATFYFYRVYNANINAINQQNWLTKLKVDDLVKNSDAYKESLEGLSAQFKNYTQTISSMEEKVNTGETNTKGLLSKMQSIKLDIEDWQKKYSSTLAEIAELKEKTDILMGNIDQARRAGGNVDLGQISVHTEGGYEGKADETKASVESNFAGKKKK